MRRKNPGIWICFLLGKGHKSIPSLSGVEGAMCPTTRVEGRVKSEREGGKGKAGNAINRTFIRMISFRHLSECTIYTFNLGPVEAPEMYSKLVCRREQLPKRCVLAVPPRLTSEGYRFVQGLGRNPHTLSYR